MDKQKFKKSWGKNSHVLTNNWCNVDSLPSNLEELESLLRTMPEERLFVRETQDDINAKTVTRIRFSDVHNLAVRLKGEGETLHLLATNLENYSSIFDEFKENVCLFLKKEIPGFSKGSSSCSVGVFLSTPGAIAPFHADPEHNFLIQIKGEKCFHSFPTEDYESFPLLEREQLAVRNIHTLGTYSETIEERAVVTQLSAGMVLYHPPFAPHWVSTDKVAYSISYSISFFTPDVDNQLLLYKMNYYLRKLGLIPKQLGKSLFFDGIKIKVGTIFRLIKQKIY